MTYATGIKFRFHINGRRGSSCNSYSCQHLIPQADKEFVWSLWKRLQVANPDLTQAVSLVVER